MHWFMAVAIIHDVELRLGRLAYLERGFSSVPSGQPRAGLSYLLPAQPHCLHMFHHSAVLVHCEKTYDITQEKGHDYLVI